MEHLITIPTQFLIFQAYISLRVNLLSLVKSVEFFVGEIVWEANVEGLDVTRMMVVWGMEVLYWNDLELEEGKEVCKEFK